MEIKYNICDKIAYFNTAECKVMTAEVKSIRVLPRGIKKDEAGNNVLEGVVVLYETVDGPVLAEQECFASVQECFEAYRKFFSVPAGSE